MSKPNFSRNTREAIRSISSGYCQVEDCLNKGVDYHHMLPNTKANQKKYPLFLQSPINCILLCRYHHDNYSSYGLTISEKKAKVYEEFLRKGDTYDK